MRVVSLLPSATEILFAVGAGERVVGVTHECDHPPKASGLPSVTLDLLSQGLSPVEIDAAVSRGMRDEHTIYAIDSEALGAAQPDVVVTQQLCEVCAVPSEAVRQELCSLAPHARVVAADPHTLGELTGAIRAIGEAVGSGSRARELGDRLEDRLGRVERAVSGRPRPAVAVIEWPDPLWLAGHWLPDMVDRAGGRNLLGASGEPSRRMAADEFEGIAPDVVVAGFCGFDLAKTVEAVDAIADERRWRSLVGGSRVIAVDGSAYFSRPGPRLVDGVELLAYVLHGVGPIPASDAVAERSVTGWRAVADDGPL